MISLQRTRLKRIIIKTILTCFMLNTAAAYAQENTAISLKELVYHTQTQAYCYPIMNCRGYNFGIRPCTSDYGSDTCEACPEGSVTNRNIKHSNSGTIQNSDMCSEPVQNRIYVVDGHCNYPESILSGSLVTSNGCSCDLDRCVLGHNPDICYPMPGCEKNHEFHANGTCVPCQVNKGFYKEEEDDLCGRCPYHPKPASNPASNPTHNPSLPTLTVNKTMNKSLRTIIRSIQARTDNLRSSQENHFYDGDRLVSFPDRIKLTGFVKQINMNCINEHRYEDEDEDEDEDKYEDEYEYEYEDEDDANNNKEVTFVILHDVGFCGDEKRCTWEQYLPMYPNQFTESLSRYKALQINVNDFTNNKTECKLWNQFGNKQGNHHPTPSASFEITIPINFITEDSSKYTSAHRRLLNKLLVAVKKVSTSSHQKRPLNKKVELVQDSILTPPINQP